MSGRSSHLDFYFISTTLCIKAGDRKKGGEEVNKKIVEATDSSSNETKFTHIWMFYVPEKKENTYDAELCRGRKKK